VNIRSWLLWALVATTVLTTMQGISQGLGATRMSFPLLVGSIFTGDRDRARIYGAIAHFVNGIVISLLYVLVFQSLHKATWWIGAILGIAHAMFLLVVVLPTFPGIHPRMASENHGPTATRYFEPPGFLGLNFGVRTPLTVLLSHTVFGIVLGAFYHLA
jgi:uncharacterized membrane protein YagU involved in acid resistance